MAAGGGSGDDANMAVADKMVAALASSISKSCGIAGIRQAGGGAGMGTSPRRTRRTTLHLAIPSTYFINASRTGEHLPYAYVEHFYLCYSLSLSPTPRRSDILPRACT